MSNNIINNIDLDKISQTVQNGKKDKSTLRKPVKLQGEWNFDPSKGYQFKTELSYEKGKQAIEIDSPSFLGGNGKLTNAFKQNNRDSGCQVQASSTGGHRNRVAIVSPCNQQTFR